MDYCDTWIMWIELDKCLLCWCVLNPTLCVYQAFLGYGILVASALSGCDNNHIHYLASVCLFIYYFIKCLVPLTLIFSNPEQSKHLETARMRLFDMWIDFVNLRSEEYSNNSRIPTKVYSFRTSSLWFSMIIRNKSRNCLICYISGHFCSLCSI